MSDKQNNQIEKTVVAILFLPLFVSAVFAYLAKDYERAITACVLIWVIKGS